MTLQRKLVDMQEGGRIVIRFVRNKKSYAVLTDPFATTWQYEVNGDRFSMQIPEAQVGSVLARMRMGVPDIFDAWAAADEDGTPFDLER